MTLYDIRQPTVGYPTVPISLVLAIFNKPYWVVVLIWKGSRTQGMLTANGYCEIHIGMMGQLFDSASKISFTEEILRTPGLSRSDSLKIDHLREQIMLYNH